MAAGDDLSEAERLESLWSGEFGDQWSERNMDMYEGRRPYWDALMTRLAPNRVLDVGCNVGGNLRWIAPHLQPGDAYGIDINRRSLDLIHEFVPDANVLVGSARELPFRDDWFDLVFTVGVLIHHPQESVGLAIEEMVRCSSRYILAIEMYAPEFTEVVHRGVSHGLFKRDYGALFLETVPTIRLADEGFLAREDGFDSLNWWLFEKTDRMSA